jgi:hypothetical protein
VPPRSSASRFSSVRACLGGAQPAGPRQRDPARPGRRTFDEARLGADLDQLGEVAVLEGWWLAADVADAAGSLRARAVAMRLAEHVAREAAERCDAFRAMAATRQG